MEKQASYEIFSSVAYNSELFIWITENMLYLQSSKQHNQHLPYRFSLKGRGRRKSTLLVITRFLNLTFDKSLSSMQVMSLLVAKHAAVVCLENEVHGLENTV